MEKRSRLLLAQVDHASGEMLGFAVERLMDRGASNVQLIPTVTKKNRPGHLLLIDTSQEGEAAMAEFLAQELKVTGYHRIETAHVFQRVTMVKKQLLIKAGGRTKRLQCMVKLIGDPSAPLSADIEHDFLVSLQRLLRDTMDCRLSLDELRTMIEAKVRGSGSITLEM